MTTETDERETETPDGASSADRTSTRQQDRATIRRCHKMLKRSKSAEKRFRPRCEQSLDFYFGDQWDPKDRRKLEERGQPVITLNRCRPTSKLVHGLVIGQPQDWLAKPVGKNDDNLAEIGTAGLKFVANQTNYKDKRALAYWWGLNYGLGVGMWGFHVDDENPKTEPVQLRMIDPREFRRDPQSRKLDGSDMRWGIWSRKVDLADAQRKWPKWAKDLAGMANATKDSTDGTDDFEKYEGVAELAATGPGLWGDADWNQADDPGESDVKQVLVHELWEIRNEPAQLIEHANGYTCEYDPANPESIKKLASPDVVRFYTADVPKVYKRVFCGSLLLESDPSIYEHGCLPFVLCWHEMDHYGDPYSFIESLKDPQREINHRRSKMVNELNNPNLRVTPQVLERNNMTSEEFRNAFIKGGFIFEAMDGEVSIVRDEAMTPQQFSLMQDSKAEIQSVSGVNDDLIGYDSSSKSGIAKQTQMEQGAKMQRPNEANLGTFDKMSGKLAFALIQQAHKGPWIVRVTDNLGADQYLGLNQQSVDPETGETRILNDINQTPYEIEIETKNWSPTDRQSASENLTAMAQHEQDPIVRTALNRAAIEVGDMPSKGKVMEIYDKAVSMMMGGGQEPDPAAMQAQQEHMQMQAEAQKATMAADVSKAQSGAEKAQAEAHKAQIEAAQAQQAMQHGGHRFEMELRHAEDGHGRKMEQMMQPRETA